MKYYIILICFCLISCKKEKLSEIVSERQNNIVGNWLVKTNIKIFHSDSLVSDRNYYSESFYNKDGFGGHSINTSNFITLDWTYQFDPELITTIFKGASQNGALHTPKVYKILTNTYSQQKWQRTNEIINVDSVNVKFIYHYTLDRK